MTENVRNLVNAVANGDINRAKKNAILVLEADKSQKDKSYCERTIKRLRSEPMVMQLPPNISAFATMEDVSETFIEERYYLSKREWNVLVDIAAADKVGEKLQEKRIRHLNATLLYGESGTGKTTFGKYVAYKLGIPFLYLNISHLISSLLGQTGQNIQRVFDFAKQQRCVLMLDEIDAIGSERGSDKGVGEMSRVVISLIQSLDLLGNNVVVLAATNRFDVIDKAIARRFTRSHEITRLLPGEKRDFAKSYLANCGYELDEKDLSWLVSDVEKQSDVENRMVDYIIQKELEALENEK